MADFKGEKFSNQTVHVDGHRYFDCTFTNVTVTYSGGEPPSFSGCSFDSSRFAFEGAAARTTAFLEAMSHPASGMRDLVKKTFPALFRQ